MNMRFLKKWGFVTLSAIGMIAALYQELDEPTLEPERLTQATPASSTHPVFQKLHLRGTAPRPARQPAEYKRTESSVLIPLSKDADPLELALREIKSPLSVKGFGQATQQRIKGKLTADQIYLEYPQVINGMPVEGASTRLMIQATPDGMKIVRIDQRIADVPASIDTTQRISEVELMRIARTRAGASSEDEIFRNQPKIKFLDGAHHATREVQFEGNPKLVSIDVGTGESWVEERLHTIGQVTGRAIERDTGDPQQHLTLMQMPYVQVKNSSGTSTYTSKTGSFTLQADGDGFLTSSLTGKFCKVTTRQGAALTTSATQSSNGDAELVFNDSLATERSTAQINAYVHTNLLIDWLKERGFTHALLNKRMTAHTNLPDSCNAYYTAGQIHFFSEDSDCRNSAIDTVIYHEFGHFIDEMYGDIQDGGLSEGWGDIVSLYLTEQPTLAKGLLKAIPNDGIRDGGNTYVFPPSGQGEVHEVGQAWMGFAWKLRLSLINRYGKEKGTQLADELVLPSLISNTRDIPGSVQEVLQRNATDGIPQNAPDRDLIRTAAAAHGLEGFL